LNVKTFKIDSKSKIKSSRSLRLEYNEVGFPSSSVSDSLNSAVSNDYLGVSPSYPNLSSSSLSLKLSMSSFYAGDNLSVALLLGSDAFSLETLTESCSRCFFINSSIVSSSSSPSS
jgi:hypothetical protein